MCSTIALVYIESNPLQIMIVNNLSKASLSSRGFLHFCSILFLSLFGSLTLESIFLINFLFICYILWRSVQQCYLYIYPLRLTTLCVVRFFYGIICSGDVKKLSKNISIQWSDTCCSRCSNYSCGYKCQSFTAFPQ